MTTLYLLENEGFHSGKDEGNITKQHRDTAITQPGSRPLPYYTALLPPTRAWLGSGPLRAATKFNSF